MSRIRQRVDSLCRRIPLPRPVITAEMKRAWCIANGIDPRSTVLGLDGAGVVVLGPEIEPDSEEYAELCQA